MLHRKMPVCGMLGMLVAVFACHAHTVPPPGRSATTGPSRSQEDIMRDPLWQKARDLAQRVLIVDTHIDVPYRLQRQWEDISQHTNGGDFDYPRARRGGLNVAFMSIYVPASYEEQGGARAFADRLIDLVETIVRRWPDKFAIVRSVDDVRRLAHSGKILLALGMENGAPLEGNLDNLRYFYRRGIRYITLAHAKSNHISDSSYDEVRRWHGLSPFGREVVREMNRLGIMIDVSHISDEAFEDVIAITQAPVIASHSSCRHFTPGWERNMSDAMIRKLAANGGVIQINFGAAFISDAYRKASERFRAQVREYLQQHGLKYTDPAARAYIREARQRFVFPTVTVRDVADHIDHVVRLVGIDHVGLGSDFDGVGGALPEDLRDVSMYPNLLYELLRRGYTEDDIRKIAGENLLRVWATVERVARQMQRAEK